MTRAMESLTLTWAAERRRHGSHVSAVPSRFLREIPRAVVTGSDPLDALEAGPGGRSLDWSLGQDDDPGALRGARVRHPMFGAGTILEASGVGAAQKLRIRFDRAGVKTILVRYANLEFG
jgi:DNA helicase-2/ATP-dependent DNA helicase PcrA